MVERAENDVPNGVPTRRSFIASTSFSLSRLPALAIAAAALITVA